MKKRHSAWKESFSELSWYAVAAVLVIVTFVGTSERFVIYLEHMLGMIDALQVQEYRPWNPCADDQEQYADDIIAGAWVQSNDCDNQMATVIDEPPPLEP